MATRFEQLLGDWIGQHKKSSCLILGFGLEGRSTYRFLKKHLPEARLAIMDQRPDSAREFLAEEGDTAATVLDASSYLVFPEGLDCIFKSPGIPLKNLPPMPEGTRLLSQTDLFLEVLGHKTIGITGTKGKSTTASLARHLLAESGAAVELLGNIGLPAFEMFEREEADWYVFELSSHQLETVSHSPHIAMLLNLYEEHLDHYISFAGYREAKLNIGRYQQKGDFFICDVENRELADHCAGFPGRIVGMAEAAGKGYSFETVLPGSHNRRNIEAVLMMLELAGVEVDDRLLGAVSDFKGLRHRLEVLGTWKGITFVDDSISTIPQAAIAAIESFGETGTVIIGGMDRGISYSSLVAYLNRRPDLELVLLPDTGHKLSEAIQGNGRKHPAKDMGEAVAEAYRIGRQGTVCLLSPAAASYGFYKNFEERGDDYAHWVRKIGEEA